jgi:hypothetical protein
LNNALLHYTCEENPRYDPEVDAVVRKARPEWFRYRESTSESCSNCQQRFTAD